MVCKHGACVQHQSAGGSCRLTDHTLHEFPQRSTTAFSKSDQPGYILQSLVLSCGICVQLMCEVLCSAMAALLWLHADRARAETLSNNAGCLQGLWSAAQGQPSSCAAAAPGVREVRLHPRLPLAVVQHASSEAFGQATPIGRLPAAAAAAARQLLSLSILSLAHPTAPITIAPSHSRLSFWSGPEIGCVSAVSQLLSCTVTDGCFHKGGARAT